MEEFKLKEKIHLVGIGGISMSALAQYFLAEGYAVSGSDVRENEQTLLLRGLGAEVCIGRKQYRQNRRQALYIHFGGKGGQCGADFLQGKFHSARAPRAGFGGHFRRLSLRRCGMRKSRQNHHYGHAGARA